MSQIGHNLYFDHSRSDFAIFKSKLENVFVVNDVTTNEKKRAYLLTSISEGTYKLLASLCVPKKPDDLKYDELVSSLEKYFKPVKSYFACRRIFYSATQNSNESVREYAARLKSLAGDCGFNSTELDLLLRDIFLFGLHDTKTQDRLQEEDATSKDITFEKMLSLALARESSEQFSVKSEPADLQHFGPRPKYSKPKPPSSTPAKNKTYQQRCQHCGRNNHLSSECNYKNYLFTTFATSKVILLQSVRRKVSSRWSRSQSSKLSLFRVNQNRGILMLIVVNLHLHQMVKKIWKLT